MKEKVSEEFLEREDNWTNEQMNVLKYDLIRNERLFKEKTIDEFLLKTKNCAFCNHSKMWEVEDFIVENYLTEPDLAIYFLEKFNERIKESLNLHDSLTILAPPLNKTAENFYKCRFTSNCKFMSKRNGKLIKSS